MTQRAYHCTSLCFGSSTAVIPITCVTNGHNGRCTQDVQKQASSNLCQDCKSHSALPHSLIVNFVQSQDFYLLSDLMESMIPHRQLQSNKCRHEVLAVGIPCSK